MNSRNALGGQTRPLRRPYVWVRSASRRTGAAIRSRFGPVGESAPSGRRPVKWQRRWCAQNQIVYETVYDTECYLVPTTQMRTEYKTECKTETVPVTSTVIDQVPTTEMHTEYRTEYRTKTVPVTRTVIDQIPSTVMQTKYRTEYKTQTVPVTRTVMDQVPTTQMQTRYRTEYKTPDRARDPFGA